MLTEWLDFVLLRFDHNICLSLKLESIKMEAVNFQFVDNLSSESGRHENLINASQQRKGQMRNFISLCSRFV